MSDSQKNKELLQRYNMSHFFRGQASKIITAVSEEDHTGFVCKHGKPIAVLMSNERYERLLNAGIDINEF